MGCGQRCVGFFGVLVSLVVFLGSADAMSGWKCVVVVLIWCVLWVFMVGLFVGLYGANLGFKGGFVGF